MNQNGTHHSNSITDLLSEAEKPLNVQQALYKYLLRYWYLYVIGLGVALTLAYLQLRYAARQYQVFSKVLIKTPESGAGGEGISQEFLLNELGIQTSTSIVQNETHILKSRTLMHEVVKRLNLHVLYEMEGRIRNGERYLDSPILVDTFAFNDDRQSLTLELQPYTESQFLIIKGEDKIPVSYNDTVNLKWGTFAFSRNLQTSWDNYKMIIKFRNSEVIAQSYANKLRIEPAEEWSSVLQLSLVDPVSQKAADILNTLVDVYNDAAIKDKNRVAENTYAFINERLKELTNELSGAESEVEQFKTRNLIPSGVEDNVGTLFSEFNGNDSELSKLEMELSLLKGLENMLTEDRENYDLLPINLLSSSNSGDIAGPVNKYNDLVQERKRRLSTLTQDHPVIQQLNDEIAASRIVIVSTIGNAQKKLRSSLRVLQRKNQQLQAKLRSMPSVERDLTEIVRQKDIKENLYIYLLQKREESALSMAVAMANARVVDAAKPNDIPIEPKPSLIYSIALFLGLGIPFAFIIVKDLLNDTIQTPDDLKQNTVTPLIGSISYSYSGKNIVVSKSSRSAVAEMFRMLRTNLQFFKSIDGPEVLLITSGGSGEGKTFVSINLGMSMAISGKRTLLVGLDLRKPKLAKYLDKEDTTLGITNYLIGETPERAIIHPTDLHPDLYFIPSGPIPPNPAELIMSEKLNEFLDYAKTQFDCIILDTPPVGLVADALLLNEHITGSIFVVRYGKTKKSILSFVDELYKEKKLRRLSLVLNGIKTKGRYGYGYEYGKGYGYYEEDKKRIKQRGKRAGKVESLE